MIKGNPKRSAISSIGGYIYQFWVTLWSWIKLGEDDKLYIECGEDFEIVENSGVKSVQVKNKQSNVTLNSKDVIDSINNFWELVLMNPNETIEFKYLTTANIGIEKKNNFDGESGIDVWKKAKSKLTDVEKIKEHLLTKSLSDDLKQFLKESSLQDIQSKLINKIEWVTGSEELLEIQTVVEKKITLLGENFSVPPEHSKKVIDHLLVEVINKSTLSKPDQRVLDRANLIEEFQAQTHVTVPLSSVTLKKSHEDQAFYQPLSYLIDETATNISVESSQGNERILPEVLDGLLVREQEIEKIQRLLYEKNVVVIDGGTGIGKSTIAKFLGHASNEKNNWIWISCTGKEPKEIKLLLSNLLHEIISLSNSLNIILDDLNVDTANIHHFKDEFAVLIKTQRLNNSSLLVTSQKGPDSTFQTNFEIEDFKVPPLTEKQIRTFLENMGCPEAKISILSRIIELQSKGHPQLAHALIVGKKRSDWNIDSAEEIFSDTEEIQVKKQEARQLLTDQLGNGQLNLIYLLSLIAGSFSRKFALLLAEEIEVIEFPGDIFDSLVGPWIDISSNNRFTVSPLLTGVGQEVWSESAINEKRKLIVDKTFELGTLDIRDASNILVQTFITDDEHNMSKLIVSLFPIINTREWGTVATYLDWILITPEEKVQEIFTDKSNKYLFRLFQYKIAKEVDKEKAREILKLWNAENPLELNIKGITNRIFILSSFFTDFRSDIKPDLLIDLINDYEIIRNELNENSGAYNQEMLSGLKKMLQFEGFSRLISHQINNREKFERILSQIKEKNDKFANTVFSNLNKSITQSKHVINSLWLDEDTKDSQDWEAIINILDSCYKYFEENDFENLIKATICAKSIVLDEYLDRKEEALDLLISSSDEFAINIELKDRLASLYYLHDEHVKASKIWDDLIPEWEVNVEEFDNDSIFSCRKNAISHFKNSDLKEAQNFFFEGYKRSKLLDLKEFQAGFLADAAYVAFLSNDNQTCLRYLYESAKVLESLMPISKDEFKYFAVLKLVQSTILWINHKIKGKPIEPNSVSEPRVGMSSNPHRNEGIKELPNPPFDFTWELLYDAEHYLGFDIGIKNEFEQKVEINKYPAIRLNNIIREFSNYFTSANSSDLPRLIEEAELTFAISNESKNRNNDIEIGLRTEITEDEVKDSIEYGNLTKGLVLISLLSHLNKEGDLKTLLDEWSNSCDSIINGEKLKSVFNDIKKIVDLSSYELSQILYDGSEAPWRREYSALILLSRPYSKPEVLAYASIVLEQHKTIFKELFSNFLLVLFKNVWLKQIKNPAIFINPQRTLPKIESACKSVSNNPNSKIADIILSVINAVTLRVPSEIINHLKKQLGESDHYN